MQTEQTTLELATKISPFQHANHRRAGKDRMFGKRKRETVVVAADSQRSGEHKVTQGELSCNDPYEAFRRHFETAFTPLPEIRSPVQGDEASLNAESESDESEVSEWSGFSEVNKDIPPVLVVEHATTGSSQDVNAIDHHFQKAFMVSNSDQSLFKGSTNSCNRALNRRSNRKALPRIQKLKRQKRMEWRS